VASAGPAVVASCGRTAGVVEEAAGWQGQRQGQAAGEVRKGGVEGDGRLVGGGVRRRGRRRPWAVVEEHAGEEEDNGRVLTRDSRRPRSWGRRRRGGTGAVAPCHDPKGHR
jgi:hypothetical protein